MNKCKAINCNNKSRVKGWCWNHYYYSRKYSEEKSLSHVINQYNVNHKCKEPNCNELPHHQGYCPKHLYVRKRNSTKKYKPHKFRDDRSKNKLFLVWYNMIERCYNPKHKQYKDYGARGIKVCDEWKNDFWQFVKDMGERPQETSIERINNNDIYKLSNCKWATQKEQMNNIRKTYLLTPKKLAKLTGYSHERIRQLSGLSKQFPNNDLLLPFIIKKEKPNKSFRIFFKPEVIEFLNNNGGKSMVQFNMDLFLSSNLLSVKEVNRKTKIDIQTLYNAKLKNRIKPENLKILIKYFPTAKNFIMSK